MMTEHDHPLGHPAFDDYEPAPPIGLHGEGHEPNKVAPLRVIPNGKSELRTLGSTLVPALERAERRRVGHEKPVPVPFEQYARILGGGLWPGVHSLVAGTGAGKSTFMFQIATHAAQEGVPVLYIGLELGEFQVALRALGDTAKVSWSAMYTGRASVDQLARAREKVPELLSLPFYVEFNTEQGWAPSNIRRRAEAIRREHPDGPMLVVLDFLQLVGPEPLEAARRQPDLRERIAQAAYAAVHVANTYSAAVVLISSTARDKYSMLAGDIKAAGFGTRPVPGHFEPQRTIRNPDSLIGVGKESGEIEFSAESQTVLVRWPEPLDNGERAVIVAVPKLRYGMSSWLAMSFSQSFQELPFRDIDELPELVSRGGKGAPVKDAELKERIKASVRRQPELKSKSAVVRATTGTKSDLLSAFDELVAAGELMATENGFAVRGEENQ